MSLDRFCAASSRNCDRFSGGVPGGCDCLRWPGLSTVAGFACRFARLWPSETGGYFDCDRLTGRLSATVAGFFGRVWATVAGFAERVSSTLAVLFGLLFAAVTDFMVRLLGAVSVLAETFLEAATV